VNFLEAEVVDEVADGEGDDDGLIGSDSAEGAAVEVIEMGVGDENEVDAGEVVEMDAGMFDAFNDFKPASPVGVDEKVESADLHEERGVPDPGDADFAVAQGGEIDRGGLAFAFGEEGGNEDFGEEITFVPAFGGAQTDVTFGGGMVFFASFRWNFHEVQRGCHGKKGIRVFVVKQLFCREMQKDKQELRRKMRAVLAGWTAEERCVASEKLVRGFMASEIWQKSGRIGLFAGKGDEVETAFFWQGEVEGRSLAYPRVEGGTMDFFKVETLEDLTLPESHVWGLAEPVGDERVVPDLVLVPGLAFDAEGGRLGRGGGFYDGWMGAHPEVMKVGVCFERQMVGRVPMNLLDVRMNFIATESGLRVMK